MITFKGKSGTFTAGEAPEALLKWYAEKGKNPEQQAAAREELMARAAGPDDLERKAIEAEGVAVPEPRVALAQAIGPRGLDNIQAITRQAYDRPNAATEALEAVAKLCHLVSPAPVVASLPAGCELGIASVLVDVANETYPLPSGGKRGLDRVALAKIGAAAGVTWVSSRRQDDGKDPHYCEWQAVARIRLFDGQLRDCPGSVTLDLRENLGTDWQEIVEQAAKATPRRDPAKQLLEARKFIRRIAESKAMNRAIAALGIRRAYTQAELGKPFAVARVMFTGKTDDPELRREFAKIIAQSFQQGSTQLFGPGPEPVPLLMPPEEPTEVPDEETPP